MPGDDLDEEPTELEPDAPDEVDLELVAVEGRDVPEVEIPDVVDVDLVDDAVVPVDDEEVADPVVGPVLPPRSGPSRVARPAHARSHRHPSPSASAWC